MLYPVSSRRQIQSLLKPTCATRTENASRSGAASSNSCLDGSVICTASTPQRCSSSETLRETLGVSLFSRTSTSEELADLDYESKPYTSLHSSEQKFLLPRDVSLFTDVVPFVTSRSFRPQEEFELGQEFQGYVIARSTTPVFEVVPIDRFTIESMPPSSPKLGLASCSLSLTLIFKFFRRDRLGEKIRCARLQYALDPSDFKATPCSAKDGLCESCFLIPSIFGYSHALICHAFVTGRRRKRPIGVRSGILSR